MSLTMEQGALKDLPQQKGFIGSNCTKVGAFSKGNWFLYAWFVGKAANDMIGQQAAELLCALWTATSGIPLIWIIYWMAAEHKISTCLCKLRKWKLDHDFSYMPQSFRSINYCNHTPTSTFSTTNFGKKNGQGTNWCGTESLFLIKFQTLSLVCKKWEKPC